MKTMKRAILWVSVFCFSCSFSNAVFASGSKESEKNNSNEKVVWEKITNVNDLVGNWEGRTTVETFDAQTGKVAFTTPTVINLVYAANATEVFMFMKQDMNSMLDTMLEGENSIFTKDYLWELAKANMDAIFDTTNKYYLSSSKTLPKDEFLSLARINQNKTQIVFSLDNEIEIIFKKN